MHYFVMRTPTKAETFRSKSIKNAKRTVYRKTGIKGRWQLINGATLQKGHVYLLVPPELRDQL